MGAARFKYLAVVSMFQSTGSSLRSIMWELVLVLVSCHCNSGGDRPEQGLAVLLEVLLVGIKHSYELFSIMNSQEKKEVLPSSQGSSFFAQCYGCISQGSRFCKTSKTYVAVENNRNSWKALEMNIDVYFKVIPLTVRWSNSSNVVGSSNRSSYAGLLVRVADSLSGTDGC